MSFQTLQTAATIANNKKASGLTAFDLRGKSDICDYQLVCSGENERQTKAICSAIEEEFKKKYNIRAASIEGHSNGTWIVMDYGNLIIHIFLASLRSYYAIEELWSQSEINLKLE